MALTDAQKLDVRRWLGYRSLFDGEPDFVFSDGPSAVSLTTRLESLDAFEEELVTDRFLQQIAALDAALYAASDNLDTAEAGPWITNPREVAQRTALRDRWRRDMADFLGFEPGPNLGAGGMRIVRA